jgi:hypothetical protein
MNPASAPAIAPPFAALELVDSEGQLLKGKASVSFVRSGLGSKTVNITLKGSLLNFSLSGVAPNGTPLHCEIGVSRYRPVKSGFMLLSEDLKFEQRIVVPRAPTKWKPVFSTWADLTSPVKKWLSLSPSLRLIKPKIELGSFIEDAYDSSVDNNSNVVLAKSALLNIHWALSTLIEPVGGERTWASFVESLIFIDRERIVAQVHPDMFTLVDGIDRNIEEHRDQYEPTPVGRHLDNLPPEAVPKIQRIVSIKTTEDRGNLQLTVALLTDGSAILDADMDENGEAFRHFLDATLVHKFTGGTHPNDIYECIRLRAPDADLGYTLA